VLELFINKSRTNIFDLTLLDEDGNGVVLDVGDVVRIIGYRRPADTPAFNLASGASATANGSSLSITSTVPTPEGTVPTLRLNLGQGDLTSLVAGAPLKLEITVADANGSPSNALLGPIHGFAWVIGTSGALP
jgi:hypothetical protein